MQARTQLWCLLGICAALWAAGGGDVAAQEAAPAGRFVDRIYRDQDGDHKYVVFEPAGYTPTKRWPLIFYLHGASGRGKDGRAQLVVGLGPAVSVRAKTFPFLVVFPQNENLRSRLLGGWTDESTELDRAVRILDTVEQEYAVDRRHELLVGTSMGGFGVWTLAARTPERWKAIMPISGGGEPDYVPKLSKVPVWAFHAADDTLVPPSRSVDLVDGINAAGGRAFVSILPRGGHNISGPVFARDAVFTWLEHPERDPAAGIDWNQRVTIPNLNHELPFVPGAEVAQAIRIRVNRDLLESLSYLLPEQVPPDALQGFKPGMSQTARAGFLSFDVNLAGIHYSGQLEQARIEPLAGNILRVQLALRSLTMVISSTSVQGTLLSAQAGPMQVVIGQQYPVWLTIDVAPRVEQRQLKLDLVGVGFEIPPDNWGISRPAGVRVRPLPFLNERIADRLVSGLAERKPEIEQEVRNSVPRLLAELEARVAGFTARTISFGRWPMPLWQPRFRIYPEAVAIDEGGVTLRIGAQVAALAPKSNQIPIRQFPADDAGEPPLATTGLDAAVSARLIHAWSTLLSASDVARFHVLDLNAASFRELGRPEFWKQVLPADAQLPAGAELNTEFVLMQPLRLNSLGDGAANGGTGAATLQDRFAMQMPQLRLELSLREPGRKELRDFARLDVDFTQAFQARVQRPSFTQRTLSLQPLAPAEPHVVGGLVANPELRLNLALVSEQFARGWGDSFGGAGRDIPMTDLNVANLPLRWEQISWSGSHFVARLERPAIRVVNTTDRPVEYFIRARHTPWSERLELAPGALHEYRQPTALIWWTGNETGELMYTLPLGFQADVRIDEATKVPRLVHGGGKPLEK